MPDLATNGVMLWLVDTREAQPEWTERAMAALDGKEKVRIEGVAHPQNRLEQCLARGALRILLGSLLALRPEDIPLTTVGRGKPALQPGGTRRRIEFNLTHADGIVLIAMSENGRVGVDLEGPRRLPGWLKVARRYFSKAEAAAIEQLPTADREAAFFACWVRKEALVKATGGGIATGLGSFDVNVFPNQRARLLASRNPEIRVDEWQLLDLDCGPGRSACVAAESRCPIELVWRPCPFIQ